MLVQLVYFLSPKVHFNSDWMKIFFKLAINMTSFLHNKNILTFMLFDFGLKIYKLVETVKLWVPATRCRGNGEMLTKGYKLLVRK